MLKRMTSILSALAICFLCIVPAFAESNKKDSTDTYVLIHGLGGYGAESDINKISPYWGSTTGNLSDYLHSLGYSVFEASVGPFSSSWDRACELYAQLTGTTVDYGEAHAKEHKHERYGQTYTTPAIEDWSDEHKINLIGHSFGGTTARMLVHLLTYGAPEETVASGDNTSPLFVGNQGNLVNSITTLCTPHNGSTLYDILDVIPGFINCLLKTLSCIELIMNCSFVEQFYNIGLDHFLPGDYANGADNAGYELSYIGATELNEKIKMADNVYYFSFASTTTKEDVSNYVPSKDTLFILKPIAALMGAYEHPVLCKENDGLVNVNSALHPFGDNYCKYDENTIKPGIWIEMPLLTGHHGTIIGMDNNTDEIHSFYEKHLSLIENINN